MYTYTYTYIHTHQHGSFVLALESDAMVRRSLCARTGVSFVLLCESLQSDNTVRIMMTTYTDTGTDADARTHKNTLSFSFSLSLSHTQT